MFKGLRGAQDPKEAHAVETMLFVSEVLMRLTLYLAAFLFAAVLAVPQTKQAVVPSPKEKIEQARKLLTAAKKDLMNDGKYDCCIKDDCDRCALDHQICDCAAEVKAGKPVCSDCYAGWQRGDGDVPGVNPKAVKGSFHSHKHQ